MEKPDAIAEIVNRFGMGTLEGVRAAQQPVLRARQIVSIIKATPAMTIGTFLLSMVSLYTAWPYGHQLALGLWAVFLNSAMLAGMVSWRRNRLRSDRTSASRTTVFRAVVHALVTGTIWSALPVIALQNANAVALMTIVVVIGSVLCTAALILATMPAAALAFVTPILIASVYSTFAYTNATVTVIISSLIVCYVVVIGSTCRAIARAFVANFLQEAQIRQQKDIIGLFLREFENTASDWLWEFDAQGQIGHVSDRFRQVLPDHADITGHGFIELLKRHTSPEDSAMLALEQAVRARTTFTDVELMMVFGERERWWRLTGKAVYNDHGDYAGYIGTGSDITSEKIAERRINFLAHYDALTGLMNRAKFTEQLKLAVARMERKGTHFAVLYLDLDRFKPVNDGHGHMVGDKLLAIIAERIGAMTDDRHVVARLGGDEFAILMQAPGLETDDVQILASGLIERVSEAAEIDGRRMSVGLSVGIAIAPEAGTSAEQILSNADRALYRAKERGRGGYALFEAHMDRDIRNRTMLEADLRTALENDALELRYQPLIDSHNSKAAGFEALVRWNREGHGMIAPSLFIPIAEQSGMINAIGDWTLRQACREAVQWPEHLFVSVNLSVRHFQETDIIRTVEAALADSGLPAERLELEITESLLLENQEEIQDKLAGLKKLGVSIALDDFGTGYSSLSYLLKFPFDKIKIDKSFVAASSNDMVARDILRSIATLGRTLHMKVTAEGVESSDQLEFLRELSCNQFQGFYFAKPLAHHELPGFLLREIGGGMPSCAPVVHEPQADMRAAG